MSREIHINEFYDEGSMEEWIYETRKTYDDEEWYVEVEILEMASGGFRCGLTFIHRQGEMFSA